MSAIDRPAPYCRPVSIPRLAGAVLPALLAGLASWPFAAAAQTVVTRSICNNAGANSAEPLGDREGHAVQVSLGTCRLEGGLLDGGVMNTLVMWEIDKGVGTALSGSGIIRKPGATTTYQLIDGRLNLVVADGRVTGYTATGKGVYKLAIGSATPLAGKTFSWNVRSTGPGQYVIESSLD